MKIEDLIFIAGGFAEGASTMRIEVARRVSNASNPGAQTAIANVFTVDVNSTLNPDVGNFVLMPFDIISVFNLPGYEIQKTVKIEGEVRYPGIYAIKNTDEKISDLLKRAGGVTALADIDGASLKRDNSAVLAPEKNLSNSDEILQDRQEQLKRLDRNASADSLDANINRNNFVGISLKKIINTPGSAPDLLLVNNDVLRIPKKEQIVRVNGEVLYPSAVVYSSGKSFKSYVDNAGSFSALSWPRRSYIIYANGTVKSTHKFLFFKFYPSVKPGSEIYIPKKPIKRTNTLQEVFGLTTAFASVGAIILGIISLQK